jgi:HTH-type transcriptional regulator / antitoxin HipB
MSSIGDIVSKMKARTPADVGLLLKARRKELGLDQSQLAERAGVSRQWLIDVEKGKPRAELGLILRTAQALGLAFEIVREMPSSAAPAADTPRSRIEQVLTRHAGPEVAPRKRAR